MRINFDALTGLRGICAIWIMIFHCFIFSTLHWNLEGSSIMPLFIMLSGFTLTIAYSDKSETHILLSSNENDSTNVDVNGVDINPSTTNNNNKLSHWTFYRNRFARAMPLFYLTMLIAIPLTLAGFGPVPPASAIPVMITANILPFATLSSFILGPPLNGVAWTVETLIFFWLAFPRWLNQVKQMSDIDLVKGIISMFYWQFAVLIVTFVSIIVLTGNFWISFATGTMNPITRFPLFLMGMYGGILVHRHPLKCNAIASDGNDGIDSITNIILDSAESAIASNTNVDPNADCVISSDTLPWPEIYLYMFPIYCYSYAQEPTAGQMKGDWVTISKSYSLFLLLFTLLWSILESVGVVLIGSVFLQAIVPMAQLTVIVSLTRNNDINPSINPVYHFLTHHICLYLGKLSMTIYLIHYLVLQYVTWIIYGHSLTWCDMNDEKVDCNAWNNARLLPVWGIPIVIIITIPLSMLIYTCFEEPVRKLIQIKK